MEFPRNCVKRVFCSNHFRNDRPMYRSFRQLAERLLRIPPDPESPPGDESTTRVFRASPKFLRYLLVVWGLQTTAFLLPILAAAAVLLTVAILTRKEAAAGP